MEGATIGINSYIEDHASFSQVCIDFFIKRLFAGKDFDFDVCEKEVTIQRIKDEVGGIKEVNIEIPRNILFYYRRIPNHQATVMMLTPYNEIEAYFKLVDDVPLDKEFAKEANRLSNMLAVDIPLIS